MKKIATISHSISSDRSQNYIRQIKGSFVFKCLSVASSFFTIPLMIHYLGQEQYGVWSTLLSIMSWAAFFDLGIGNGLRNKLAESLSRNKSIEASRYISSSYSLIGIISSSLFSIIAVATFFIPWQSAFNTQLIPQTTLLYTILISAFFIFLNFWVGLINQVLNAAQKTSIVVFGQFLANLFVLAVVIFLKKFTSSSLLYLAAGYGISIVISNAILSFWFYRQHPIFLPKLSVGIQYVRPLLSLGLQFFTIQIAVIIVFTTDKILISQLFGPRYVTQYDVIFKLFSIFTLIYSIIATPLWTSYTDAYQRGDFAWIRKILHKQLIIFGMIALAVIVMVLLAKPIIALWIGRSLGVPMSLVISMGAFVLVTTWNSIFASFVNGIGKVRPQLITSIIAMSINVPLAIIFTKYFSIGMYGVVIATCISLIFFAIVGPLQTYVELNKEKVEL